MESVSGWSLQCEGVEGWDCNDITLGNQAEEVPKISLLSLE